MKDFLNKIPRETLTVQNIRTELKKGNRKNFGLALILVALSVFLLIMAIGVTKASANRDLSVYLMWILTIIAFVVTLTFVAVNIKLMIQLKQKITIVTDWLVDIREDVDVHEGMYHRYHNFTVLTFATYGTYKIYTDIPGDINYTWSKMYAMSNKGVCNYSHIDDEFYLAITNDKNPKILQIYNQKLFELK